MDIAKKIIEYRKKFQMTQKELAKSLNCGQSTISLWEKGQAQPCADMIIKLCQTFSISADELLEIKLPEAPHSKASIEEEIIRSFYHGLTIAQRDLVMQIIGQFNNKIY